MQGKQVNHTQDSSFKSPRQSKTEDLQYHAGLGGRGIKERARERRDVDKGRLTHSGRRRGEVCGGRRR